MWIINSSNLGKIEEYKKFLGSKTLFLSKDLKEPLADSETIVRFKASQFEEVLVDDVSLEVEGADLGVNIRWHLKHLDPYIGKKAKFLCYLGIHRKQKIEIYLGVTPGLLVTPRGKSHGFNPYFLPDFSTKTFGEIQEDALNPRYKSVQALLALKPWKICEVLKVWDGEFQQEK